MADDKMRNDDLNKNMGGKGQGQSGKEGQQSPGRNPSDDQSTGQRSGSRNQPRHDDDMGGQKGSQGKGDMGQRR